MIAPKTLPKSYQEWNARNLAPYGAGWWQTLNGLPLVGGMLWNRRFLLPLGVMRAAGAFGFQRNSLTRTFEYPWCAEASKLEPGMSVIELGAGASGFQFYLANTGMNVTSVDPLINPPGKANWVFTKEHFDRLNASMGNKVTFIRKFIEEAGIAPASVDRVFSVSMVEHLPPEAVASIMRTVAKILKPGGLFIATIDLFLDVVPLGSSASNQWGTNINIKSLVESSGMELVVGNREQLCGYPEFSPERIRQSVGDWMVENDVMTQCIVLRK